MGAIEKSISSEQWKTNQNSHTNNNKPRGHTVRIFACERWNHK